MTVFYNSFVNDKVSGFIDKHPFYSPDNIQGINYYIQENTKNKKKDLTEMKKQHKKWDKQ